MIKKAYLSNICAAWPIERQQAVLGNRSPVYQDILPARAIKNCNASGMTDRSAMLAPTSRQIPERITVATFRCLAFSVQDFAGVIVKASTRGAVLHALDTGQTIAPDAPPAVIAEAIAAFGRVVRRGGKGRTKEELAAETLADTKRRAALIADDWPKSSREHPTSALLMRAGPRKGVPMSPEIARRELGRRPDRQRAYQTEINREAGRSAARARKKELHNAN